jgi:hypothetical protein
MVTNKTSHKRDNFDFPIVNFPFICSYIPAAAAYAVHLTWRGGMGGMVFLFRLEKCFRTTPELEYFFLSRKARNFFPEYNIG